MCSFSALPLFILPLLFTQTHACDDCWAWPEDNAVFQDEILNATNSYRAQHNASPLVWNETLAEGADGYVYGCKNVPYNGPYGKNKNVGYNSPTLTVAAWAEEGESYDFGTGVSSPESANFTQLVWKSSTQMGCRRNQCDAVSYGLMGWYVICYYSPKGNVEGEFMANVQYRVEGVESTTSSVESATSTVESATSPIGTPTSSVGSVPTISIVANSTRGPVSNATASGPMGTATSTPPVIDNAGAANGMRDAFTAFWMAGLVGSLVVWAV